GITEAGTDFSGTIKSSIGLGYLLLKGIGDTIRVSLSADPVKEVQVAWEILKSLGLRERGARIVSCPTCSRAKIDVIKIAKELERITASVKKPVKIAVMGCTVNGLGEGKESALAIVGSGKNIALLMKNGKIVKKGKEKEILKLLRKEISKLKIAVRRSKWRK
ncbi:MAG: flavodoxin-dependent (E)-4-hydroxy-3-methylbut-2-enyl-diphosphate synthase, partial [Candidatus Paceibacterota bacterium]